MTKATVTLASALLLLLGIAGCSPRDTEAPPDEAKAAGKKATDFPAAAYDYFRDMDWAADNKGKLHKLNLGPDEIKGRNTWIMWCGGNEAFLGWLSSHSYGFMDLLKLVVSADRESAKLKRSKRFQDTGLMNEPDFQPATQADEYGLFLEVPQDPTLPKPREEVYGRSSGIVGLRLFKNPKFDKAAAQRGKPDRYFSDPDYFTDPNLIRPYRVGMSCGFCHVGPHPLNPPSDPAEPKWANLSSNIGNQYFKTRAIFGGLLPPENFTYHVLDSQPPGTIAPPLVASDNINNPTTINAVFGVPARLDRAGISVHRDRNPEWLKHNPSRSHNQPEKLTRGQLIMPSLLKGDPDSDKE